MREYKQNRKVTNIDYKSLFIVCAKLAPLFWEKSKAYFPCKIIITLISGSATAAKLLFTKFLLDAIVEKCDYWGAVFCVAIYFGYSILSAVISSFLLIYLELIQSDIQNEMQRQVITKAFEMEIFYYDSPLYYDKMALAIEYVKTNGIAIFDSLFSGISYFVNILSAVYVISRLNAIALMSLMLLLFSDYFLSRFRDKMLYNFKSTVIRISRKKDYTMQLIKDKSAMKDGRVYHTMPFVLEKQLEHYTEYRSKMKKAYQKAELVILPVHIMNILFSCVVYVFVGLDLYKQKITVGDFSMICEAADSLKNNLTMLGKQISNVRNYSLSASRYIEFMNMETPKSGTIHLEEYCGFSICFDHVWFRYEGSDAWILQDVSFELENGKRLFLVGENGSGKTTLVNLLLGFYRPQRGRILVNGISLDEYDRDSLYSNISTVFQDYHTFAFSLGENIAFAKVDSKNRDHILKSIEYGGLTDTVAKMKRGVDTSVSRLLDDSGIELSGGQRQRLAISRAYYHPAILYVFDEPSSALDAISEDQLFRQLIELSTHKTSVIVSHRLSNSLHSDVVILLDHGKVCEMGSHFELMRQKGKYYNMYSLQAEKYEHTGKHDML